MTIKEGMKAPEFSLPASSGKEVSLKDYKGKARVILYFYPKDDTPGCTVEACGFRDAVKRFEKEDAVVLGVSPDGDASHKKFIEKFKLPFILLSDEDKKVCQAYGVWVKKSMYGRIEKICEKVKPEGHTDEVLSFVIYAKNLFSK